MKVIVGLFFASWFGILIYGVISSDKGESLEGQEYGAMAEIYGEYCLPQEIEYFDCVARDGVCINTCGVDDKCYKNCMR